MKVLFRVLLGVLVITGIYLTMLQMGPKKKEVPAGAQIQPPQPVTDARVTLKAQGCSLKAPPGWEQTTEDEGGIMFIAPKEKYVANLLVTALPFAESLEKFADQQLAKFKLANPDAVPGKSEPFMTDAGSAGLKVAVQNKISDLELAQNLYCLEGLTGQKILITTNAPGAQRAELEPIFDSCIKTLTLTTK